MYNSEGEHGPPSVGFFDDHVDVGELGEIGPLGGSVGADCAINFRVGSVSSLVCVIEDWWDGHAMSLLFLDLGVFRHGLNDGQNQR